MGQDLPQDAERIGPGTYHGSLHKPLEAMARYVFSVEKGDEIQIDLSSAGDFGVVGLLRFQTRVATHTDEGFTTFGIVNEARTSLVYAPYGGDWYLDVKPVDHSFTGSTDYTFTLEIHPDVAHIVSILGPSGVMEAGGAEFLQYHIEARVPSGSAGVVSMRDHRAVADGDGWRTGAAGFEVVRTAWGETFVSGDVGTGIDEIDEHLIVRGSYVSILGSSHTERQNLHKVTLYSSSEDARIHFAVPKGTEVVTASGTGSTFVTFGDLEGTGLATPVYAYAAAAQIDVDLGNGFVGSYHGWDGGLTLKDPDGNVHQYLPSEPVPGAWSITADHATSWTPDAELPILWGSTYDPLGIYPEAETDLGFVFSVIFRSPTPF